MYSSLECGISYFQNNVKIIGGSVSVPNSWPAQALVRICTSQACYLCGGTLIDTSTVLTAGHCIESTSPSAFTIFLGIHSNLINYN